MYPPATPITLQVDWSDPANAPAKPNLLGTKVYQDFPIEDLLDYIDWNPFFQVRPACPPAGRPACLPACLGVEGGLP